MRSLIKNIAPMPALLGVLAFAAVLVATPLTAQAATSGGATIHNAVTVSYTSGTQTLTATATNDVTVITLAAAPTITVATAAQTTTAGGNVTYTYTIRSNSNGSDTYTPSAPTSADTGVSAPTLSTPAAMNLWGGIALGSGAGTITIPAGSEAGLVAGTSTVEIAPGQTYTVSAITAGTPASTNTTTGVTTAETPTTLTLTPIGASTPITAGSVAAGTQIGEYTTFSQTVTAGTPTTPGTDGTHVVNFNVVTTATDAGGATITTAAPTTTTTVSSPSLTIQKLSRNVTTGGTFAATGTTAKPGEILEYQITVTNAHASASATGVYITDAIPAYTAFNGTSVTVVNNVGGTPTTTNPTTAADGDAANLTAGTLTVNLGSGAGSADVAGNGGTIAAGDNVVVTYQVTVQ